MLLRSYPSRLRHAVIKLRDRVLHGHHTSLRVGQLMLLILYRVLVTSDLMCLRLIFGLVEALDAIGLLLVVFTLLSIERAHHLLDYENTHG